jgi:hypothetical protein
MSRGQKVIREIGDAVKRVDLYDEMVSQRIIPVAIARPCTKKYAEGFLPIFLLKEGVSVLHVWGMSGLRGVLRRQRHDPGFIRDTGRTTNTSTSGDIIPHEG